MSASVIERDKGKKMTSQMALTDSAEMPAVVEVLVLEAKNVPRAAPARVCVRERNRVRKCASV